MTALRTTLNEPGGQSRPVTPTPNVPCSKEDEAIRYLGEQVSALGTGKQPLDALLTSISALTFGADTFIYGTGADAAAVGTVTAFARSFMAAADEAAFKQLVNLEVGVDVQAHDAELAAIAGLTSAANKVPYFTGSGTAALADFSTFGRSLVDDADASSAHTTLGLGTMATQSANAVAITGGSVVGITDLAVADGGTGASTAAQAATNLGLGTGDSPQFAAINIGHASDTTITRTGAGDIAIEGNAVYRASGTDVPIADGGTGRSSHTAYAVLCGGTTATGSQQSVASVGTDGQVLRSAGADALPAFEDDIAAIGILLDGNGSAITTGIKGWVQVPFACTIKSVTLLADQTGSIAVDIWKDTYANYPPTDADSITASAVPSISSANKNTDTTLTGWTKTIAAGDVLYFNVDSCTTIQKCNVTLKVTKT